MGAAGRESTVLDVVRFATRLEKKVVSFFREIARELEMFIALRYPVISYRIRFREHCWCTPIISKRDVILVPSLPLMLQVMLDAWRQLVSCICFPKFWR